MVFAMVGPLFKISEEGIDLPNMPLVLSPGTSQSSPASCWSVSVQRYLCAQLNYIRNVYRRIARVRLRVATY